MMGKAKYTEVPYQNYRKIQSDYLEFARKSHNMAGLLEVDITEATKKLEQINKEGRQLSLVSYIVKCISKTAINHPHVHAMRKGYRKLVLFEQTDIYVMVEKDLEEHSAPLPLLIKQVEHKSVRDIQDEIQDARKKALKKDDIEIDKKRNRIWLMKQFPKYPTWLRRLILKNLLRRPLLNHSMSGSIGVTSLTKFGRAYGWGLPGGTMMPLIFAMGGTTEKPLIMDGEIVIRDVLCLTIIFDHDVVDGAPAARFTAELFAEIESAALLDNYL